jgi:hypothetical protein
VSWITFERYLHRVDGPDDKSEASDRGKELANLATLGHGVGAAVNGEHPDDNEVGNAGNGVPAPLLRGALTAVSGEETGKNHDDIGNNGQKDVATAETGEHGQIEEEERGGQAPVDVTGPVDLAVDIVGGVRDVAVRVSDSGAVVADAVAGGHGEVGQRSKSDDESGDNVVDTLGDGDGPREANEDNHGEEHQNADGPQSAGTGLGDGLVLGKRGDNSGQGSHRAGGLEGLYGVDNHGGGVDCRGGDGLEGGERLKGERKRSGGRDVLKQPARQQLQLELLSAELSIRSRLPQACC